MKKSNFSDGVLVFDRYYGRKPVTAILIAERILFCIALSVFSMLFIITEYGFNVSPVYIGAVSGICAALFSVIFIFVRRSIAIPILIISVAALILFNFEEFWKKFSYFVDEAMLLVEGRFLFPRQYLIHNERYLADDNLMYRDGMLLGCFILCALFALLCAASCRKRIRCVPSLIGFVALCVPRILSETFEFNLWFFPVIILFSGAAAIGIVYRNGLAVVRTGSGIYRRQVRSDENVFLSNIKNAGFIKKISMRFSYFSKYVTSGVYCALIFTVALGIGLSVFGEGKSIDYSPLYDFVAGFSEDVGISNTSPFESGPVSDYFTSADTEKRGEGLDIISPGSGDTDILRVTFSGDRPIYLRGDIGVDFTGDGWTTHVTDKSRWLNSGLGDSFRPCEPKVIRTVLRALDSRFSDIIRESNVIIEYLCETDVVFMPGYTSDFSYYGNENFDVYGDFVVRVNTDSVDFVNSVQCTALFANFGNSTAQDEAEVVNQIEQLLAEKDVSVNDFYGAVVSEIASYSDVMVNYEKYVSDVYLTIPVSTSRRIRAFIENDAELRRISESLVDRGTPSAYDRYRLAAAISDYLSKNYKYTLSGENTSSDPVMEFLTRTKKGHCSLYASAMTLMLRELGIPARYCTGFAVSPQNNDLSNVTLKEKNLHAWVEVYLGDLGWVTFDPTSAAMNASHNSPSQNDEIPDVEPDVPEESEPPKPDIPDEPITPNAPSEDDTSHSETPSVPVSQEKFQLTMEIVVLVCSVLVIGLLVVILTLRYKSVKGKAEKFLNNASAMDGRKIYAKIVDLLYFCKIRPEAGQLPSGYFAAADEMYGTSLEGFSDILEKAAFGNTPLSTEERHALADMLSELYSMMIKRSFVVRRHLIRKLLVK